MLKKNILARLFPMLNDEPEDFQPVDPVSPVAGATEPERAAEQTDPRFGFPIPDGVYSPPVPQRADEIRETEDSLRGGAFPLRVPPSTQPQTPNVSAEQFPTTPRRFDPSESEGLTSNDPVAADTTPAPKLYSELPELEQRGREVQMYRDRLANPQNRDKGARGALLEGIQNFLFGLAQAKRMNPRANWKEVLAGGGMGAGLGFLDRSWNERRSDEEDLARAQGAYNAAAAQRKFESDLETAGVNRRNIDEDNRRMEQQRQDRAVQDQSRLREQKRANLFRQNKFFDPAKATEAQRRQLAEFGETPETVGGFDFSNPKFKKVGDTEFRWDPREQAFVDAGLPKDKSKAFTELTIKDPTTNKTYTLVTTQEKAASFLNQRIVAGMQIEAAKDRQISSQNFQREENDKNRQQALQIANSRIATANRNIELAEQRLAQAAEAEKRQAQKDLNDAKLAKKRLKAYILDNPLISDNADLLEGLDDEP